MLVLLKDLPDKAGLALGSINIGIGVKMNRFTIRFTDGSSNPIELYADDAHTKSEWIQGIGGYLTIICSRYSAVHKTSRCFIRLSSECKYVNIKMFIRNNGSKRTGRH